MSETMETHKIATREEWQAASAELLEREKEHTRTGDELARERRANGQLAARAQLWDPAAGAFRPHHTAVLTLRGALIEEINTFLEPWALTVAHGEER
jgi:Bacterial protein of unknown function (DUF899)